MTDSVARRWAATTLPLSRAHLMPPPGAAVWREPAHGEALLRAHEHSGHTSTQALPDAAPAPDPSMLGVGELLACYRHGQVSPSEVLRHLGARAGADGPAPEAVLCRIPGAAEAAEESTRRWRTGTARALEGVPFGVKDIMDVAGTRVTHGSLHTGDRIADADATCVARLRAAGAVPAFMLATTEYACGAAANARYGAVPNPWNRARWAGGSSTGAGAALAARLLPLALGSDTGGSIRIPAALCGVTGLKPTRGLVPRTGVATLSWTLDHIGPMARSAADIARVLPLLAGPDGADPLAAALTPDLTPRDAIKGMRIGVPVGWFTERCDVAVLAAWRAALDDLQQAGAALREVTLPDLGLAHEEAWLVFYTELASCQESRAACRDRFDAGTRERIERGEAVPAMDYLRALRRRPQVQARMLAAMEGVDVLVTPGLGAEAPFLSDSTVELDGVRLPMYEITPRNTMIFDYTGFPALMLPAGFGAAGLPVGIQIVARPFQDALCLAMGIAFQARTHHHLAIPAVAGLPM
jgi:aspartyl-tRNA(Asn)/glutamyl-tRNA(Gln) amidotransferase subunit A